MEGRILAAAGKVTGLAGLVVGSFLLIFRGILATKILPNGGLEGAQALALLMFMMALTFGMAGIGIVGWLVGKSVRSNQRVTTSQLSFLVVLIIAVLGFSAYAARTVSVPADSPGTPSSENRLAEPLQPMAKNAPQSSIAGKTAVAGQATNSSKFYVGTVTAGDGTDATYTRNAKEFLSNELGSSRLEDPDNGERVDAVISNVGADDLPEPGGNFWRGHAKIAATLHPPTPSGQIELVPSSSSDRVLGSDENDASLKALADAASKLVQKLKGYADNRFR